METDTALIVVDTQNDFCPGGGYAVANGDEIIGPLNDMLAFARKNGWLVVTSKDWHTRDLFADESKVHCIQGTKGAELHKDLGVQGNEVVVTKGAKDLGSRHYSAFNGDEVSLDGVFKEKGIKKVFVGGLAFDYCVKNTAIDSVKLGYETTVLSDATKAVKSNHENITAVESELRSTGVLLQTTKDVTS